MQETVTFFAVNLIYIFPLAGIAVWLSLNRDHRAEFIKAGILGGLIAYVLALIAGRLYYNPRPFVVEHTAPYFAHANTNGFPSNHTLFVVFIALLVMKYNQRAGTFLLVLGIVVGLSRVVANVHHIIDIFGAAAIAAAGFYLAQFLLKGITKKLLKSIRVLN